MNHRTSTRNHFRCTERGWCRTLNTSPISPCLFCLVLANLLYFLKLIANFGLLHFFSPLLLQIFEICYKTMQVYRARLVSDPDVEVAVKVPALTQTSGNRKRKPQSPETRNTENATQNPKQKSQSPEARNTENGTRRPKPQTRSPNSKPQPAHNRYSGQT